MSYGSCQNEAESFAPPPPRGESPRSRLRTCAILSVLAVWAAGAAYFRSLGLTILRELRDDGGTEAPAPSPLREGKYRPPSRQRAAISRSTPGTVLVVYVGGHEHQRAMAEAIVGGARSVLPSDRLDKVKLQTIADSDFDDVLNADAVIVGSPVYNANTHPEVQNFINTWDIGEDLSSKIGSAFVTAGGISAGEEGTMLSILRSLMVFRMICVGGDTWESAFGASAIVYEDPFGPSPVGHNAFFADQCYQDTSPVHPMFLEKAFALGVRIARLTSTLRGEC